MWNGKLGEISVTIYRVELSPGARHVFSEPYRHLKSGREIEDETVTKLSKERSIVASKFEWAFPGQGLTSHDFALAPKNWMLLLYEISIKSQRWMSASTVWVMRSAFPVWVRTNVSGRLPLILSLTKRQCSWHMMVSTSGDECLSGSWMLRLHFKDH